jgi:hypothetical protein
MIFETQFPTDLLYQRSACIRAVEGAEVNEFSQAMASLARIAEKLQTPIAIVGGLAAIHYGVRVTTQDIDIVIAAESLDEFVNAALREGLILRKRSEAGWHSLIYPSPGNDVEIQVVPEGRKSPRDPEFAPPIPSPEQLGVVSGLGYATFARWAVLKLVANRDKDRYHLVEACKHASEAQIAETVTILRAMNRVYLTEFERIVRAAEDENREDW